MGALDEARAGQGRFVEIVGEPGIGKTRLAEELRERAEGLEYLSATAEAFTVSTPYGVWRDLLREALGVGWEDADEVVLARLRRVRRRSARRELRPGCRCSRCRSTSTRRARPRSTRSRRSSGARACTRP